MQARVIELLEGGGDKNYTPNSKDENGYLRVSVHVIVCVRESVYINVCAHV